MLILVKHFLLTIKPAPYRRHQWSFGANAVQRSLHSRSHFWHCPSKCLTLTITTQILLSLMNLSHSPFFFSVLILQLLRFRFTCLKKPQKDNMAINLSREIVVNLGSDNTAQVKNNAKFRGKISHFVKHSLLTLSFSRFTTHLLASLAILEKRPMGVSFMTHLSPRTFLGVNHLNYVSPFQATTSVRACTMRLTKVTWRTVGSPLTMRESARQPARMCAATGRSQLTCYSTRDESRRVRPVAQGLGTEIQTWGQTECSVWKENGHHLRAMPPEACFSQIHCDDLLLCRPSWGSDGKLSKTHWRPAGDWSSICCPQLITLRWSRVNAHWMYGPSLAN